MEFEAEFGDVLELSGTFRLSSSDVDDVMVRHFGEVGHKSNIVCHKNFGEPPNIY